MSDFPSLDLASAEWLAHRYDRSSDRVHFRRVARDGHSTIPFLTDEYIGGQPLKTMSRLEAVSSLDHTPSAPLHFLFHSAFCASTMLVHALNIPGTSMGLSEPVILNDIVGIRRRREMDNASLAHLTDDAFRLLGRPYGLGEAIVIKPSNIFNPLAAMALAMRAESKALLLYAPLEKFLISVTRKGLWCRLWVRELMHGFVQDALAGDFFSPEEYFRQSDLQVAAVGWLIQQKIFSTISAQYGGRIATLDSETLTRNPAYLLPEIAAFYGLSAEGVRWVEIDALHRNSKSGHAFAVGERQLDQQQARLAHSDEIDKVLQWAEVIATQHAIPLILPAHLTG